MIDPETMNQETGSAVRAARSEDIEQWLVLRCAFWPQLSPEQHRQEIAHIFAQPQANIAFLDIGPGEEISGFVEVSLRTWAEGCESSPVGYLEGWYVAEHARGQGIGAQLIHAAEDWARAKGCIEMASDTELANHLSQAVHQHLGYELVEKIACFRKPLAPTPEAAEEQ